MAQPAPTTPRASVTERSRGPQGTRGAELERLGGLTQGVEGILVPANVAAHQQPCGMGGYPQMLTDEKDRFYSRLATIPGIRPMPSPPVSDWILLQVDHPQELARRVNRKLAPGVVSIPRQHPGSVRVPVGDPRANEQLLRTIKEAVAMR